VADDAEQIDETKPAEDVHARALKRFDAIIASARTERLLSLVDRRFVFIEGAQWEDEFGEQFANSIRIQANKIQRGHDKVVNDYRANRFTVNFRPKGGTGDDDTAELLNGLLYADMYRSKGQQALDNAFGEGASGGMGGFRLRNEFEDDEDPDSDHQRICVEQIEDADQRLFFDPAAKLYDKSDARYAFLLTPYAPDDYRDEYGEGKMTSWPEGIPRPQFDWYTPEAVFVAEYYEIEQSTEELRIFTRAATDEEYRYWAKDITPEMQADLTARGFTLSRRRNIKRRRVHKWLLSGEDVLEDVGHIAGRHIPLIPYYGKRAFIDGIERFKGHVRDGKDMARVYNALVSKLMETTSLSPREVPIFAPEQMEGLQTHWAEMNILRHPYALAHPLIDPQTGSIVSTGPVAKLTPPEMPPVIATLIQLAGSDIAEITNGDDGSMEIKSNVSGEAMDIAASRVDAKSFVYMDNFKQTVQRFGEVYYSMACEVYVEEGREVETMDEDGETATATLHELHTDPATKVTAKRYDLSVGKFNVIADVTEATATRRDKTVRTMMALAQAAATVQDLETAQAALLVAVENMDGEGVGNFQKFAHKKALAIGLEQPTPEEQQAAQGEQQQPDPAAIAQLAQAKALSSQANKFDSGAKLDEAKTVLTLAQAKKTNHDAKQIPQVGDTNHMLARHALTFRKDAA
jgi:hypothetical protein